MKLIIKSWELLCIIDRQWYSTDTGHSQMTVGWKQRSKWDGELMRQAIRSLGYSCRLGRDALWSYHRIHFRFLQCEDYLVSTKCSTLNWKCKWIIDSPLKVGWNKRASLTCVCMGKGEVGDGRAIMKGKFPLWSQIRGKCAWSRYSTIGDRNFRGWLFKSGVEGQDIFGLSGRASKNRCVERDAWAMSTMVKGSYNYGKMKTSCEDFLRCGKSQNIYPTSKCHGILIARMAQDAVEGEPNP